MPSDEEHAKEEVKSENDSSIIKWKILDNNEVLHALNIPKIEHKSLLPMKEDEFEIYLIFLPNKFWEQLTKNISFFKMILGSKIPGRVARKKSCKTNFFMKR